MKKTEKDFWVKENVKFSPLYSLLKLSPVDGHMPSALPGQFVQVEVSNSKTTYLRRPISINYIDDKELWLLIRKAGDGTTAMTELAPGYKLNLLLPLGNGFSTQVSGLVLLVGGGVGVAPLLHLGKELKEQGKDVKFLLGARTGKDLLELDLFKQLGEVFVTTEDGSVGEKGFVTQHSIFQRKIDHIACCGPSPMMKAVAKIAQEKEIDCEVSLENLMACGIGACLCCVEDTIDEGNVCVCQDGPVFNIKRLKYVSSG